MMCCAVHTPKEGILDWESNWLPFGLQISTQSTEPHQTGHFFISLCIVFTFSSILQPYSTISVSILITNVLNSASDRLAISSSLSLFLEFWFVLSFGPYFFVLAHLLCCKGWSLRYSPGWGNPLCCVVVLYVGEGSEREQCCLFNSLPTFSHFSTTNKQIGPSWCWFRGVWLCVNSRTLLVSPMNSSVRLGVSLATSTPTGFYSQRFWVFSFLHWNPAKPYVL